MPPATTLRRTGSRIDPLDVHSLVHGTGEGMPDPLEFVLSDRYLDREFLYPRQATILKTIFLRSEMFTAYDEDVLGEWGESFRRTHEEGCQPDLMERIRICQAEGRPWFREVVNVTGRRGGKGYLGAICGAYVTWHFLHRPGGPQRHYGIDRDKRLSVLTFAAKKEQAVANQWRDLSNVIVGAPCFGPYVSRSQGQSLTLYAPTDVLRIERLASRGVETEADLASFEILPKESTLTAARGPAAFCLLFDEMAHVVATGANRSAEDVYCLDPMTRILCADLIWKPLSDLNVGERIVGFDEFPERPGTQRKMREAKVLGKRVTRGPALRISFEDGTSVVCSPKHRWFRVDAACSNGLWVKSGYTFREGSAGSTTRLKVGDRIRHIVDPWEVDNSRDGGYLAGIYDGEGWLAAPKASAFKVGFAQNPGIVLDRTRELLTKFGFDHYRWRRPDGFTTPCAQVEVRGLADSLRLLGQFRPARLLDRSLEVWEGKAPRGTTKFKRITSIVPLPVQDLIDIETSTKTFIAEGLVSHNSSAVPALDQFGHDAFIYEGSSPWQMTGQFYTNWLRSIETEPDGTPAYPEMVMFQLPSWEPYRDWEETGHIPLRRPTTSHIQVEVEVPTGRELCDVEVEVPSPTFPPLRRAIQEFDDQMVKLERANPDSFAVERRSHWAAVVDAYLDSRRVAAIFEPWDGRELRPTERGRLSTRYKAHGDPASVNDRFGFALAHVETVEREEVDESGKITLVRQDHVVFDLLTKWEAGDWSDRRIHYSVDDTRGDVEDGHTVEEDIWDVLQRFQPEECTFDQFASPGTIERLASKARRAKLPKTTRVYERTTTHSLDWRRWEACKAAINMGLVHAPMFDVHGESIEAAEIAELELRFLQRKGTRVDHQTTGPVTSKDVADCISEVVWFLIGDQMTAYMSADLAAVGVRGSSLSGINAERPGGSPTGGAERDPRPESVAALSEVTARGRGGQVPYGVSRRRPDAGRRGWGKR